MGWLRKPDERKKKGICSWLLSLFPSREETERKRQEELDAEFLAWRGECAGGERED